MLTVKQAMCFDGTGAALYKETKDPEDDRTVCCQNFEDV